MATTSIKVSTQLRDRVSRLAASHRLSQHAYLDQLLRKAEEDEFWRQMASDGSEAYADALVADGDVLQEDYALEDDAITESERP